MLKPNIFEKHIYSNLKYEIEYDYDNPEKCDIVYSNIFNYADQPFEAYENDNLILCPQPLYKKEENCPILSLKIY